MGGNGTWGEEAVALAGISTEGVAGIAKDSGAGTVAAGGGGDACSCVGSSGMYGKVVRA